MSDILDALLAEAVKAGFAAAPSLGSYAARQPAVDDFTRAALDQVSLVKTFARIHMSLVRAIEAEGYRVLSHVITGECTLERLNTEKGE